MLHQHKSKQKIKISPDSRAEVMSAIDNKTSDLKSKLDWMQNKWGTFSKGFGDCHEVRIIGPVIIGTLTPLNASIIMDNLTYFKEKYETSDNEHNFKNFQIASLCGAENIANFLFEKLESKPDDSTILTYVSASQNEEWAKKVATEMKKKDLPIPKGVSLYCTESSMKDAIHTVFSGEKNKI